MKKISSIMALVVAIFTLWGCSDDTTPRLDKDPATLTFTVNTPPMANQFFYLSDGTDETFDLSCSQPDYGFSAIANYVVMVSLSENFDHNAKFAHEGEEDYFPQPGDYVELRDPGTLANMQVKQLYLTRAICKLMTYKDENGEEKAIEDAAGLATAMQQNHPEGYMPVFIKVRCYVPQDEAASSVVSSNYAKFSKVVPSFSLEQPSLLYLTGDFNGFVTPSPDNIPAPDAVGYPQPEGKLWALSELATEIDSKIFRASFWLNIADGGGSSFRCYSIPPAAGWGATGSYGGSEADFSSVDLEVEQGKAKGTVVDEGQGNWTLIQKGGATIETGWYDIVIDLNEMEINVNKVSTPTYTTTFVPAE